MDTQKGLRRGDRVWVRIPKQLIERRIGTIIAVRRNRYDVEWDIDTREGHREYSAGEIATQVSAQAKGRR